MRPHRERGHSHGRQRAAGRDRPLPPPPTPPRSRAASDGAGHHGRERPGAGGAHVGLKREPPAGRWPPDLPGRRRWGRGSAGEAKHCPRRPPWAKPGQAPAAQPAGEPPTTPASSQRRPSAGNRHMVVLPQQPGDGPASTASFPPENAPASALLAAARQDATPENRPGANEALDRGRLQARHEASQAQPGAFGGPADAPQPGSSGRGCAVPAGEEFWGTPRIGAAGFAKTPAGTRRAKPSPTTARGEAPDASLPTRPARRHRFRRGDALAISATPPSLGRELKSGRSAPPLRSRERPRGGGCQRKRPRRVSSGSRARARGGTLRARASNAACCRQRGHGRRGIGRLRSPSYQAGQRYKGGRQPGFTPRGQDPLLRPGRTRRGGRRHKSWDFAVGILLRGGRAGLSQRWISPVLPRPSPNCPYPRSGCRGRTGNWESGAQARWTGKRLRRAAPAWPSSRPARHERSWSAKKRPKNPSFALNSSEGEGG